MKFEPLVSDHCKEVIGLVYEVFNASGGEAEAKSVRGLVSRYLENYPRADLKGFIALDGSEVVGVVFFSQLVFPNSEKKVWLLSPMAVKTAMQGRGVGKALIRYAHDALRQEGVNLVTTYGDVKFYGKSGYRLVSEETLPAPFRLTYPEGWLASALDGSSAPEVEGPSKCIPELRDPSLW